MCVRVYFLSDGRYVWTSLERVEGAWMWQGKKEAEYLPTWYSKYGPDREGADCAKLRQIAGTWYMYVFG